jgi:hypothetical protein
LKESVMTDNKAAKEPAYLKEIREAGIEVSPYEARRFRTALLHLDLFQRYMAERIDPSDLGWLKSFILHSDGYWAIDDQAITDEEKARKAANSLRLILEDNVWSEKEKAEAVSKWLLKWASEDGILKLRTAINGLVSGQKRKRSPISVYKSTRDRFVKIMQKTDADSADDLLNQLMDAHEAMHGR